MLSAKKVWIVAIVICMTTIGANGEDYNKEEHGLLCNVLAAAVKMWGTNGKKVSDSLKQALKQTIFGTSRNGGEDPKTLKLQSEYHYQHDNSHNNRYQWCGACGKRYFPGESAPHDLLCVCTPGKISKLVGSTLCGRSGWGLIEGGWGAEVENINAKGKTALESTWKEIIQSCVNSRTTHSLKEALNKFKENVERNQYRFGGRGSEPHSGPSCDGMDPSNTCVNYKRERHEADLLCTGKQPWWQKLYEAVKNEPPEEEIRSPTKAAMQKRDGTQNHSKITAESHKTKKLTTTSRENSRKNGNPITRSPWSLLVIFIN